MWITSICGTRGTWPTERNKNFSSINDFFCFSVVVGIRGKTLRWPGNWCLGMYRFIYFFKIVQSQTTFRLKSSFFVLQIIKREKKFRICIDLCSFTQLNGIQIATMIRMCDTKPTQRRSKFFTIFNHISTRCDNSAFFFLLFWFLAIFNCIFVYNVNVCLR